MSCARRCVSLAESPDVWQATTAVLHKNLFFINYTFTTNLQYQFSVLLVIYSRQFSFKLEQLSEKHLKWLSLQNIKRLLKVCIHIKGYGARIPLNGRKYPD